MNLVKMYFCKAFFQKQFTHAFFAFINLAHEDLFIVNV
jgi:hypothetical protein